MEAAPGDAASTPAIEPEPEWLLPRKRQGPAHVITVVSGKGGVGKSVVVANLAGAMAKSLGLTTAVVDLSLQYGDQALLFDAPPSPSLVDVLANVDALTPEFVLDCMHHKLENLHILAAPPSPELSDLVTPAHVHTIMDQLRVLFDVVVVDTATYLYDVTLDSIDIADHVVVVTSPYLASVKGTKLLLKLLGDLSISGGKITAVLNRVEPELRISFEVVEANLKFPLSAELPHTALPLLDSATDGAPLTMAKPQVDFAQRVAALARRLTAGEVEEKRERQQRKGFLRLGRP